MNARETLSIFLLISILWSCNRDPKLPAWDVEVLTPLANTRLDIADLFKDTLLSVKSDSALSLVYEKELNELKPDEVFEPLNASFNNSIKLEHIDLGTPSFSDYISLGDLAKGGSPAGQFIIANHGNTAIAPPFLNIGPKSFGVNASNLFQDMTLTTGDADVVFDNDLPITITNINFRLENSVSGTIIFQDYIDSIPAKQTVVRNFDLSGQTIEGNMKAVLQNFSSKGTGNQAVLIDTSDRITVTVSLNNLVASSATAIFPDQNLAMDTNYSDPIPAGNALLSSIIVDEGSIYLDATSTIQDVLKIDYDIPGASYSGNSIAMKVQIPSAPVGGSSNSYTEVDLKGYAVDLTGKPGDVGIYNQFYTILIGRIDSSGQLRTLSTSDSVVLKTGVVDLTASRGFGYLGKDTITSIETESLEVFDIIQSGSFDLAEARMGLSIENYIGAPLDIKLNDMFAQSDQSQKTLVWNQLGQFINVPSATVSEPKPNPGYLEIELNSANSNFEELIEIQPNQISSNLEAILNNTTVNPIFNQFIFTEFGVRTSLFLEVPFHMSLTDVVFSDTAEFNYEAFDPNRRIQDGVLKILANNHFPFEADVVLILLDKNDDIIDSLVSPDKILAPVINNSGKASEVKKSIADYPLTSEQIAQLYETRNIIIKLTINTPASPDKVKLYIDSYADLVLAGDLRIRTN